MVNPSENFFYKKYSSVECDDRELGQNGKYFKVKLKKINCEVDNCYWDYLTLVELASMVGFELLCVHSPVGKSEDNQNYMDEYLLSSLYLLCV